MKKKLITAEMVMFWPFRLRTSFIADPMAARVYALAGSAINSHVAKSATILRWTMGLAVARGPRRNSQGGTR